GVARRAADPDRPGQARRQADEPAFQHIQDDQQDQKGRERISRQPPKQPESEQFGHRFHPSPRLTWFRIPDSVPDSMPDRLRGILAHQNRGVTPRNPPPPPAPPPCP